MNYKSPNGKSLRQIHKLKQEQKLTPRQVLQIRITQIPRLELEHLLYQELELNPMLEFREDDELNESPYETDKDREEQSEKEQLDEKLKEFFEEDFPSYFAPTDLKEQPEKQTPYVSTFAEDLKSELRLEHSEPETIRIGEYLIDSLNNDGFLDIPLEFTTEYLGVNKEKIEKVLNIIQGFDPPGIAARDSQESLSIQMKRNPLKWKLELKIIEDYWDYYKKNDADKISNGLNIDKKKVREALNNIRKLTPHPTNSDFGEIRYVIPNVFVSKKGENYEVAINEPNLPFFRLNTRYLHILQSPGDYDKKTVMFMKKWMDRAIFVLRCLHTRKKNFGSVINYIISKQKDFLKKGILFMKPLRLTDIAKATNLSESTISRYIKDTYIQTPRGVFHLKYLLSGGIQINAGAISTNVIREKIKRMIDKEGKTPLTDREIADILKKEGIDISRRTVDKYRNQMGISSSRERKRERKLYE